MTSIIGFEQQELKQVCRNSFSVLEFVSHHLVLPDSKPMIYGHARTDAVPVLYPQGLTHAMGIQLDGKSGQAVPFNHQKKLDRATDKLIKFEPVSKHQYLPYCRTRSMNFQQQVGQSTLRPPGSPIYAAGVRPGTSLGSARQQVMSPSRSLDGIFG
jgi:hypothetical protein